MADQNEELEDLELEAGDEIPSGLADDEEGVATDPVDDTDPVEDDEELERAEGAGDNDEGKALEEETEQPDPNAAAEGEQPDPAAKPDEGAAEEEEELEEEPFAPLEGAVRYKGQGVFIPEGSAFERLEAALNGATTFAQEREQLTGEIAELKEFRSAEAEIGADIVQLVFKDLPAMDVDGIYEWAVDFVAKLPELKNTVREKLLQKREAELERREKRGTTTTTATARAAEAAPALTREQALGVAREAVAPTLEQLYAVPELAALTPADKTVLSERISANVERYISVAGDDAMAAHGIKKGDAYLNAEAMLELARERAEVRAEERGRQSAARVIANKNRRKLGTKKVATGAGGGRTSAGEGEGEHQPAKTREEWLARMEMD